MDVTAVSFEQDHARATVTVTPKIAGATGMQLVYNLDRKGDKWVVNGNAQSAGSGHGTQGSPGGAQSSAGRAERNGTAAGPSCRGVGIASRWRAARWRNRAPARASARLLHSLRV